ncbi:MAG: tripartite tricarboxylate transporter TctB family protein [Candidatus Tectomicrobia bacterium]|nr:tripartite tricarboxylate transporter TctB family protein [Candidatus Tectomicrobia bacterium]
MESEKKLPPSRALALLEVWVSALIALAGAGLGIAMPSMVLEGGIREAQEFMRLTPVFFPRLAFGVMAVLGLVQLARAIRRLPGAAPATGEGWISKYQNPIVAAALIIAYAYLIPWLGFSAAGFAGIAAITVAIGSRSWREILPIALLSPLVIRFVFERLLLISLPRSPIDLIAAPEEALMQFLVRLFFLRV